MNAWTGAQTVYARCISKRSGPSKGRTYTRASISEVHIPDHDIVS